MLERPRLSLRQLFFPLPLQPLAKDHLIWFQVFKKHPYAEDSQCPSLVPSFPLNLRLIDPTTLEGHLKYNTSKRELLGFPPKPAIPTNSLTLQITDLAAQVKKNMCHLRLLSLTPHIGSFNNTC